MGNLIKWRTIDPESTFTFARIWRATSETGVYSQIASQPITDASYYDPNGTSTHWYKIDFWDTVNLVASELSDPIHADTFKGYCTVEDIRDMTNITASDLTDTEVCKLISIAGIQINADMLMYEEEEPVAYIDDVRQNKIDGVNTTFYTKNFAIGDLNDDMQVTADDLQVYIYPGDGTKSSTPVTSVTPNPGKFVLTTAPPSGTQTLTVTYKWAPRSCSDPDAVIKLACVYLVGFLAYNKLNIGKSPQWRMGSTTIYRDMDSPGKYYEKYQMLLSKLNDRAFPGMIESPDVM
jgi:hypothetical protein